MKKQRTTVGIAIPAYGRGRHLGAALDSVLAQTRQVDDVVVVDDCSPDDTGEVARRYADRGVRYLLNEKNLGVPFNYNHSLAQLKTDYVMILEDHDILEPTYVERCAGLMDAHPDMTLVATRTTNIDEATSAPVNVSGADDLPEVQPGWELARLLVTHLGCPFSLVAMIRRSALTGLEPYFDPRYWWYADNDLWIRLGLRGEFGYLQEPLLRTRMREQDHFLENNNLWKGFTSCDRIRKDNWDSVYPRGTLESTLERWAYYARRDFNAAELVLSRKAYGDDSFPDEAREALSPPGRVAVDLVRRLPRSFALALRHARRSLRAWRAGRR